MVIDGMVVPVADPAAQRAVERGGYQINSCLNKTASQKAALSPGVPGRSGRAPAGLRAQVERAAWLAVR